MFISNRALHVPPFYVMEVLEQAQELERRGRQVIHLEIGEPDFNTASHICEAASKALMCGDTRYTHSLGIFELREAVAEYYNQRFSVDVRAEQVVITSGTSPALLLVFMALLDEGCEVVMPQPYYACYPNFVRCLGGVPVFVSTFEEGFIPSPQKLAEALTARTRAILINSPANPTGAVMPGETLEALVEVAGEIPVISDEIYQGMVYEGEEHSLLEYTDNAFVLNGFSKVYAMTGWRLGYVIAPRGYVRVLQRLQQNFFICANSFVQRAGIAAIKGSQHHVQAMVEEYDRRRRYMLKELENIGFKIGGKPAGAYYILADAREFSSDSLRLSRSILEGAGVAVTPGVDFGAEGYLRFSYAASLESIKEGLERIGEYLSGK
jgi:aspartate aminotransferase